MNTSKINGYTEEEAKCLLEYVWEGKKAGKTLTCLFKGYGEEHGRAKGSVRNYYYALMKKSASDERVVRLLDGKNLSVEEIKAFTPEETHEALKSILAEKSKGVSVRRAILNIAGDDDKKMLRLQNKYRNVLKKQPELIEAAKKELGLSEKTAEAGTLSPGKFKSAAKNGNTARSGGKIFSAKDFSYRRLEKEINGLYERIAGALKAENLRLKEENASLKKRLSERS